MERTPIHDLVIIGAGPAGSSLAAVLARLGWDVVLLEQRPRFGHKVCGEFISWEAQSILRSLGLYKQVKAAEPVALERAVLSSRLGLATNFALAGQSWGLSRRSLDRALAAAAQAAGTTLRMGARVLRFGGDNRGYSVEVRSNGNTFEIKSRAVIAAAGRVGSADLPPRYRSRPTDAMARSRPRAGPLVGIKRHYANVRMPPQVELYFFQGGYVGLAPVEAGWVNLCMLASTRALDQAGKDPAELIARVIADVPQIARRLDGATALGPAPLAAAPVDLWRRADPWDSVACVGDAAAMIPPLAGDGIAAALRSVELCAPLAHAYLGGRISLEQWERSYRREWHASLDAPLALARRLETALGDRLLSDLLIGIGSLLPPVARKLAELTRSRRTAMISGVHK